MVWLGISITTRTTSLTWMKEDRVLTGLTVMTWLMAPAAFVSLCCLSSIWEPAFLKMPTYHPNIRWLNFDIMYLVQDYPFHLVRRRIHDADIGKLPMVAGVVI